MGNKRPKVPEPGFNIDRARDNLTRWLRDAGVVAEIERVLGVDSWLRGGEHDPWVLAELVANAHMQLHGGTKSITVDGEEKPYPFCVRWPCREAGASFALWELHRHYAEQQGGEDAIATDLATVAQQCAKLDRALLERLASAAQQKQERYKDVATKIGPRALKPSPWAECVTLAGALLEAAPFAASLAQQIRSGFLSTDLRQRRPGTRGRPRDLLLVALCQHLASGGFDRGEIGELVPDDGGGSAADIDERVRKRLFKQDCRSLVPAEDARDSNSGTELVGKK